MVTRRSFIKKAAVGTVGMSVLSSTRVLGNVMGANERINFAIIGTGGRAYGLAPAVAAAENARVSHICDVDAIRLQKFKDYCKKNIGYAPVLEKDFRNLLSNKEVDAVIVATPEHWHAPMAIMAMQAGKHVYVEKPCSHNPHETELLIEVQKKTGMLCQMGNQQRSSKTSAMAVREIQEGIIGTPYMARPFMQGHVSLLG